jgi:acetyltransferase EpsM
MRRRPVILIGGGEHGRLVADAVRSNPAAFELIGFVDPKPDRMMASLLRVPHLGDDTALTRYPDALAVVAFGTSQRGSERRGVVARLAPSVSGWATVVHRDARVAPDAVISEGAVVLAGAVVLLGARIGAHAVIDAMAFVGHDVAIGDCAFVAAGAMVGGGASVGGALIRDHCTVGADSFVGMGAIVVSDVASGARVIPRGIGILGPQAWKGS